MEGGREGGEQGQVWRQRPPLTVQDGKKGSGKNTTRASFFFFFFLQSLSAGGQVTRCVL